jgi:RNA polymerase sigma-70 factor (ECF subfamily)
MGATDAGDGLNGDALTSANGSFRWDEQVRWLRPIVAARLGEPQAVDEVLQEIALQTVRRPAAWAAVASRPGWLYRVALRQCLLYRRKHGRQRRLIQNYAQRTPSTSESAPDPLAWLLAGERLAQVRQAIGRLPARDAEFLLLKYAHDFSYAQIAERLGISTSAVEARLHRARERLRRELHDEASENRGCDEFDHSTDK